MLEDREAEWKSWQRYLRELDPEMREKIRRELQNIDQKKPEVKAFEAEEKS